MQRSGRRTEGNEAERPVRDTVAARRETSSAGAAVPPPLTADVLRAAQGSAGNAAVTGMIARRARPAPAPAPEQFDTEVPEVLSSGGKQFAGPIRQEMESRFGTDFSDVRLHTGGAAARSARAIGARAYTSGSHVVLGPGGGDKHTLAHELTHVVQQRQGPVAGTDSGAGLRISDPSDRFEREAESNARRVMSAARTPREAGQTAPPAERTQRQTVQRWADQVTQNQADMEVSAGGLFAVPSAGPTSIWIRVGTAQGAFSPALRPTSTPAQNLFGTGDYQEHELTRNILDDCLHTAEEIMHDAVGELADGANSNVRTSAGLKAFGMSDESNRERAGDFQGATDRHASPVVGQSYLMLAMNPGETTMSQYHAAAVVGLDGTDTVTMEAFAGSRQTAPNAMTYSIGTVNSFHDYWTGAYYTPNHPGVTMKTVVIVKRGKGRRVPAGEERPVNPNVP
ncbi:DUF4157 domain-containing protein [Streptomyces sp. GESEQ-35]|uniref:eCIS core domain-containing protein n=1 Tax=Streptomyces sp. GESEQ-35 TaxID=2812657 RepID=UPI001B33B6B8|nr:DUF4157 domain-containing protein [Streptomyces sp. GESEQ-35]